MHELMKQKGDKVVTIQAFEEKVDVLHATLYRVACAYLGGDADRADAVQEALFKAWKSQKTLKKEEYFETWLIRILIRECVNIGRAKKRVIPVEEIPERAGSSDLSDRMDLRTAIMRLPEKQRIPLVLFYMEGYDVEQISKVLHLPKGTVCSRLARSRAALKEAIGKDVE